MRFENSPEAAGKCPWAIKPAMICLRDTIARINATHRLCRIWQDFVGDDFQLAAEALERLRVKYQVNHALMEHWLKDHRPLNQSQKPPGAERGRR